MLHDAFESVLGHQHGETEVVDEALHGREHVLGGGRVECRRRFVEHEHARMRSEHRADRDSLRLASGQRRHSSSAQVDEAEQIERVLDATAHHLGRDAERFHRVRELVLDRVGDEGGRRVLADHADHIREFARRVCAGVTSVDAHPSRQPTAGEVRDEAVDGTEQRRLAAAGAADDDTQLALGNVHGHVAQHGLVGACIADGDVLEVDHAGTTCGTTGTPVGTSGVANAGTAATSVARNGTTCSVGHANTTPSVRASCTSTV